MNPTHKDCGDCGNTLPVTDFTIKDKKTGRLQSRCKSCVRAYGRTHYVENTGTYTAKAARNNAGARARNVALVRHTLLPKFCAECNCDAAEALAYFGEKIHRRQPVDHAVHQALSVASVLKAIEASTVLCPECLEDLRTKRLARWSDLSPLQRELLRDKRGEDCKQRTPLLFKGYRRGAAPAAKAQDF